MLPVPQVSLGRSARPSPAQIKRIGLALIGSLALSIGCGGKAPSATPPCDQICKDNIALRALRETMRYVYNQRLPGQPVGEQDASASCLMQGTVQIMGDAGSNAVQGATIVELTYV